MKEIKFTCSYLGAHYEISFESDSVERNRPIEVVFSGFKLDVPELRISHPLLYAEIKKEMTKHAAKYWAGVNDIFSNSDTRLPYEKSIAVMTVENK
ncbi:MAG TPA: hypothetical protein VN726_22970 [Hanamia sp.]|nr:hypothetical protein [Hanamia sp.]